MGKYEKEYKSKSQITCWEMEKADLLKDIIAAKKFISQSEDKPSVWWCNEGFASKLEDDIKNTTTKEKEPMKHPVVIKKQATPYTVPGIKTKFSSKRYIHVGRDLDAACWHIRLSNTHGKTSYVRMSDEAMYALVRSVCELTEDEV